MIPRDAAWRAWGGEPFRLAREEGKLPLLLLAPPWCAGCRGFESSVLSDPAVSSRIAASYLPIRVEPDRRPDLADRYGRGGWPTVSVLLPDGRPLAGAVAPSVEAMRGLLDRCAALPAEERERIGEWLREGGRDAAEGAGAGTPAAEDGPSEDRIPAVRRAVLSQLDPVNAGFFGQPKFPMTDALAFLRDLWYYGPDPEAGEIFLETLSRMARSPLFDPAEGGFFRYAAGRDWSSPVREKLLADNAALLGLLASAHELSGEAVFAEAGRDTLRFLLLSLFDRDRGAFFTARSADEAYYSLPPAERVRATPPAVDPTIVTEYNARALSAMLIAARAFSGEGEEVRDDGLARRALRLGGFLAEAADTEGETPVRFRDAGEAQPALLGDETAVAAAFLDLYAATSDTAWLDRAGRVLDRATRRMYREGRGGFADRQAGPEDVGLLRREILPFSRNAEAAAALVRYGREAGREAPFALGRRLLGRLGREFDERQGPLQAAFGSALLLYRRGKAGQVPLPGDPASSG